MLATRHTLLVCCLSRLSPLSLRPPLCPAVVGDVSALTPGGVRIGTPAMTSRGLKEEGEGGGRDAAGLLRALPCFRLEGVARPILMFCAP